MIVSIIVGLIVGIIARFILPGKEALPSGILGIVLTAVVGIVGSMIGTFIGSALWGGADYAAGWIMSIVGAVILLFVLGLIFGKGKN